MSAHTTFKIGGPARLMAFPKSEDEIALIIKKCQELSKRYIVVGNGSNLLVDDGGIDAVVIALGKDFAEIKLVDDTTIYAEAGAQLMKVCRVALENELGGLEFAYGIPGSCGGGAFMNAGAYGGELREVVFRCEHIDKNGEKGFIVGMLTGAVYYLTVVVLSLALLRSAVTSSLFIKMAVICFSSSLGGILGVNRASKHHSVI